MNEEDLVDESFNVGCINSNYIFCAKWGMEITEAQYQRIEDCFPRQRGNMELPKEILERACLPIERMLEISARPLENTG